MSVRNIVRTPTAKGYATPTSAPIYVDSDDNKLKLIPAGSGTTEVEVVLAGAAVNVTASTYAVTKAINANKTTTLSLAAGQALTLPAATGSGDKYRFIILITYTGASTIKVASATDYMIGTALLFADGGDTTVGFATANTGTVATESDTITTFATGNTTGGIKGAVIEVEDIATAVWAVQYISDAAGTEATPFSAGV